MNTANSDKFQHQENYEITLNSSNIHKASDSENIEFLITNYHPVEDVLQLDVIMEQSAASNDRT